MIEVLHMLLAAGKRMHEQFSELSDSELEVIRTAVQLLQALLQEEVELRRR
jgi:hypothetical protein